MIKNATKWTVLVLLFGMISCKDRSDYEGVKTDSKNMVVPQEILPEGEMADERQHANIADYPVLTVEGSGEHDFGTINEGDKVAHTFVVKNTGKTDLLIVHAQPSCGCTVPEWTKEPIKPGQTGELKIVFDSAGKPGQQNKQITLQTNTASGHEVIRFKANVTPKAK